MYWTVPLTLALLLVPVWSFDCSAKELQEYNFKQIKGVLSAEEKKNTPPSTTTTKWHVGICENLDSVAECSKNLDVCGVQTISVDGKDYILQKIEINSNIQKKYTPFEETNEKTGKKESGVVVSYTGVNWGDQLVDADIRMVCGDSQPELAVDEWTGSRLTARVVSKAACARGAKAPKPPAEDHGELWGWFTWIFIFMVLFLSIYIIGGAWFQYNKGNAIDFLLALREVLENFLDLVKGLPVFIKEIIEKFTGNPSRGEYSAV